MTVFQVSVKLKHKSKFALVQLDDLGAIDEAWVPQIHLLRSFHCK